MSPVVIGDWDNIDGLVQDFDTEEPREVEILLAYYSYANYSGDAYVLFRKDGSLLEVHGSHCSCYGLEGQWCPEETFLEAVEQRVSSWEQDDYEWESEFKNELRQVLKELRDE